MRSLFEVQSSGAGRLATALRPRGHAWLSDDLRAFREAGVDVLVSMLMDDELSELRLVDEAAEARRLGLDLLRIPTVDRGVPASTPVFHRAVEHVRRHLDAARFVAVHCRAGIGRSFLLVAAALVARGVDPESAWRRLETTRGRPVPDTAAQREWMSGYAAWRALQARR